MNRNQEFQLWNKFARTYQEKFMNLDLYDSSYDFFINALGKKNAAVLDVGCGPGNISRYLQNKIPELRITGIDYADEMISLAAINIPEGQFIVMDCRDISGMTQRFDGIICGFVIPYLSDQELTQFMTHVSSLLNINGVLYLSFVEGSHEASGSVSGSTGDSLYFHYQEPEIILNHLNTNGLKLLKEFRFNYTRADRSSEIQVVFIAQKHRSIPDIKC